MKISARRHIAVAVPSLIALLAVSACSAGSLTNDDESGGAVEITYLVDNSAASLELAQAIVDAFNAANPDVKVTVDTRAQGTDGDNAIKTRLATGDMPDVFFYNSGSLLQALDPAKNLVDLSGEDWTDGVDDGFKSAASIDGKLYGAPGGTAVGGGVLYNKKIYADLGLSVPTTWDEFMANSEKIKAAGIDPVIQSYGDTWSSQVVFLADFHNVLSADSDWVEKYDANDPSAKFAVQPALQGFERLQELHESGYVNADFASMKYDQGVAYLSEGKGAQYPMLTFAIPNLVSLDEANNTNIGFFGLPGDTADDGMSLWEPSAIYIPTSTTGDKLEAAKKFIAFAVSSEGCDAAFAAVPPNGPSVIDECKLPDSVPDAVKDMQAYVDAGTATPALEFLSPVKGPNLEKITVEVGSGIKSAAEGGAAYDKDVETQAQQL
ncbi:MAG: extracellular solute-binding protein, partial [Cellulomonadaceae bacterium]|nr:extracellular solute-binding protein [Cellulomonadaceae bacterium]